MNQTNEHFQFLWNRYLENKADSEEVDELFNLLSESNSFLPFIEKQLATHPASYQIDPDSKASMLEALLKEKIRGSRLEKTPIRHISFLRFVWLRYAIAVVLILGGVIYLLNIKEEKKNNATELVSASAEDAMPGADKAILTLADGSTIILDSASNGQLAKQGNVAVLKTATGELAYSFSGSSDLALLNTMRTPRGGQYRLTLSDGTRVWLNAASSITYPAAFTGNQRNVSVTGEVYFEVAHDKNKPFSVEFNNQVIEVLGTSFNINAYQDEPFVRSTLVEGSVKLTTAANTVRLEPGQQASVTNQIPAVTTGKMQIRQVDTEIVTAWKNGVFNFNDAQLSEVMRQLARWYDIEINYEESAPDLVLVGEMQRSLKLSQVLKFLEKLAIHYRFEGNTLFILKK